MSHPVDGNAWDYNDKKKKTLEELKAEKAALAKQIEEAREREMLEKEVKDLKKQAKPKGRFTKLGLGLVGVAKTAGNVAKSVGNELDKMDETPKKRKAKKQ